MYQSVENVFKVSFVPRESWFLRSPISPSKVCFAHGGNGCVTFLVSAHEPFFYIGGRLIKRFGGYLSLSQGESTTETSKKKSGAEV